jgi:hypothetical protein
MHRVDFVEMPPVQVRRNGFADGVCHGYFPNGDIQYATEDFDLRINVTDELVDFHRGDNRSHKSEWFTKMRT